MTIKVNIREYLEGNVDHNGQLLVCAAIDLDDLFHSIPEEEEVDIDELLAENREIAIVWSIDDVKEQRPDLTDEQAWEVLQAAKDSHQADIGINYSVLDDHAQMLFGDAPETDGQEEE